MADRELRLALSMNGGVSLAVWIGGAVCEIDRLRTGDDAGFWPTLLAACGYNEHASIDVLTGASAGGLNAVMLAQAIRKGRSFEVFRQLWIDRADIDQLIKGPRGATRDDNDPRGILDGQYFRRHLLTAITTELDSAKPSPSHGDHDLALFASATLISPNGVSYTDAPGNPIQEPRSEAYFHIARRGENAAARGLDGFGVDDIDEVLADIGRATSSIPGLFEPMTFHRNVQGEPSESPPAGRDSRSWLVNAYTHDRSWVEIMDGGVVDNVPIARAIPRHLRQPCQNQRAPRPALPTS